MAVPNMLQPWNGEASTLDVFVADIQDLADIKFCDKDLKKGDAAAAADKYKTALFRQNCDPLTKLRLQQQQPKERSSWDELMTYVKENFGKPSHDVTSELLEKMVTCCQGTKPVKEYVVTFRQVLIDLANHNKALNFLEGDLSQVSGFFLRNGLVSEEMKRHVAASAGSVQLKEVEKKILELDSKDLGFSKEQGAWAAAVSGRSVSRAAGATKGSASDGPEGCWFCDAPDHMMRQCPKLKAKAEKAKKKGGARGSVVGGVCVGGAVGDSFDWSLGPLKKVVDSQGRIIG